MAMNLSSTAARGIGWTIYDIREHNFDCRVSGIAMMFRDYSVFWFGEDAYALIESLEYYSNSNINSIMLSPLKLPQGSSTYELLS